MKPAFFMIRSLLATTVLVCLAAALGADDEHLTITAEATATQPPIPITLVGYTGEAESVLRFDLYVAGFKLVGGNESPQYELKGANNGQVEGRLTDAINKTVKFAKAFSGGTTRSQAHALADAVVQAVTGVAGIAGGKIAFKVQRNGTTGPGEVYVADYDGHNATAVTHDNAIVADPCWIPGRRALIYNTYKFGNPDIIMHDLSTGARSVVARYAGSNISPAASPDGRHVAMILSKGGSPDVYVANIDGSGLRQLTHTPEDESSPCWSPDGRWICFATRMEHRRVLAKISVDGGAVRRITANLGINPTEPDWSPDGKQIAFTSQAGKYFRICVVPAQGGDARILADGQDPAWAANSRTLIFNRMVGGRSVLSLLDVPTKQNKDVPLTIGNCSQPSWAK